MNALLTQGDSPELRVAAAELLILETYNVLRITQRFDFGCGQRYAELMRRRRELTGRNASRELLDAVAHADTGTFTPAELAQAWSNVGAPKLRRAESEREKYGSTGVVRTLEVWRRVARRFDKPTELPAEVEPAPFEYLACSCCGHVETRQADVEPPSRCEHCGAHHTALVNFGDLDAAEAFSEGLSY